jgi:hypothetical protein
MTMNAKSALHAELRRAFPGVEFDTRIDYKREEITIGWQGGPEKTAVHARIGTAQRWQLIPHRRREISPRGPRPPPRRGTSAISHQEKTWPAAKTMMTTTTMTS